MIFSNRDRYYHFETDGVSDRAAKKSLERAFDDVIDAGLAVFQDKRLSRRHRNGILKAVVGSERMIDEICDALAPLDVANREQVLCQIEVLLRESVDVTYAVAIADAADVLKASQAEAMRAAKTSPERELAIEKAIRRSDPNAKKRVQAIIVEVAKAGFRIRPDAVRERLKKAAS